MDALVPSEPSLPQPLPAVVKAVERPLQAQSNPNENEKWSGNATAVTTQQQVNLLDTTNVAGLTTSGLTAASHVGTAATDRLAVANPSAVANANSAATSASVASAFTTTSAEAADSGSVLAVTTTAFSPVTSTHITKNAGPVAVAFDTVPPSGSGVAVDSTSQPSFDPSAIGLSDGFGLLQPRSLASLTGTGSDLPSLLTGFGSNTSSTNNSAGASISALANSLAPVTGVNSISELVGKMDNPHSTANSTPFGTLVGNLLPNSPLLSGMFGQVSEAFSPASPVSDALGGLAPGLNGLLGLDKTTVLSTSDVLGLLNSLQSAAASVPGLQGMPVQAALDTVLMTDFLRTLDSTSLSGPLASDSGILSQLLPLSGTLTGTSPLTAPMPGMEQTAPPSIAALPTGPLTQGLGGLLSNLR